MTRAFSKGSYVSAALAILVTTGCDIHEVKAVRVAVPQSRVPISMSEHMVVDTKVVSRKELKVVGVLNVTVKCARPNSTADVSNAINEQVSAAAGQGVIGFTATVAATGECQNVTFTGEIVKRGDE